MRTRRKSQFDPEQLRGSNHFKYWRGKVPKLRMCRCQTITSDRASRVPQNNSRNQLRWILILPTKFLIEEQNKERLRREKDIRRAQIGAK